MSMTTRQAFAKMINLRGIHNELEMPSSTVRAMRKRVNDNPDDPKAWKISLDYMEELLERAGYTKLQETKWM